ncbi:unnamed protein product, partial [Pylaiella littoralis]
MVDGDLVVVMSSAGGVSALNEAHNLMGLRLAAGSTMQLCQCVLRRLIEKADVYSVVHGSTILQLRGFTRVCTMQLDVSLSRCR